MTTGVAEILQPLRENGCCVVLDVLPGERCERLAQVQIGVSASRKRSFTQFRRAFRCSFIFTARRLSTQMCGLGPSPARPRTSVLGRARRHLQNPATPR